MQVCDRMCRHTDMHLSDLLTSSSPPRLTQASQHHPRLHPHLHHLISTYFPGDTRLFFNFHPSLSFSFSLFLFFSVQRSLQSLIKEQNLLIGILLRHQTGKVLFKVCLERCYFYTTRRNQSRHVSNVPLVVIKAQ